MQRPRRTSEFTEDTQTRRQSRQKRSTLSTRASSLDRISSTNNALLPMACNSASQVRTSSTSALKIPTPLRMPLFKSPGRSGHTALQNDKRWVQEQVQRVTNYLRSAGTIPGIPHDFFNSRSGGLRQMSIRQFVSIVNFFLQFVSGSRFTVSISNHIADMVNILQKLEYPYQVNKSWLKTPNTQHAFGNVILLFDFFMDFAPPCEHDVEAVVASRFPMIQTTEYPRCLEDENIPDVEFQAQMIRHAEEGFQLWDKQLDEEFEALQIQTCDLLIQKRCGMESLNALESAADKLQELLKKLQKQRSQIPKQDVKHHNALKEKLEKSLKMKRNIEYAIDEDAKELQLIKSRLSTLAEESSAVKREIDALRATIAKQSCSAEQRDIFNNQLMDLKHIVQSKERALRDLQDFSHRQQITQARVKSQLREQIQKFNVLIYEVAYSQLNTDYSPDELQLSLKVKPPELQSMLPIVSDLCKKAEEKVKDTTGTLHQFEQNIAEITYEIEYSLTATSQSTANKLSAAREELQKYEELVAKGRKIMDSKEQRSLRQCQELKALLEEVEVEVAQQKESVIRLAKENDKTMSTAESKYYKLAKEREAYWNKCASAMKEVNRELQELQEIVDSNERLIEKIKHSK